MWALFSRHINHFSSLFILGAPSWSFQNVFWFNSEKKSLSSISHCQTADQPYFLNSKWRPPRAGFQVKAGPGKSGPKTKFANVAQIQQHKEIRQNKLLITKMVPDNLSSRVPF